jgi:lipoprotein-anchoring transpeptidase ErfK/SrfK
VAANAQLLRFFDPAAQRYVIYDPAQQPDRSRMPDPQYAAQVVDYATDEKPGTVIIDTQNKFLYYVLKDGLAIRYGVGVGKEGFGWSGTVRVGGKAEWPSWTPPAEMIERRPELVEYATGMPGGPNNPLGARALYLFDGGRDTMYRIHGTNEPWSIGHNVSSGCIRMLNEHVTELHRMVQIGAKVIVM